MKDDERQLLIHCGEYCRPNGNAMPRDVAKQIGINPKRAQYLFEKWCGRGWLECGVSEGTGWMTDDGLEAWISIRSQQNG